MPESGNRRGFHFPIYFMDTYAKKYAAAFSGREGNGLKTAGPLNMVLAKNWPAKPARYRNHCSYLSVYNRGVLH